MGKFILISFLGNTEYKDKQKYIFKNIKNLPIKEKEIEANCSLEAIRKNIDIEKEILFFTKEAEDIFNKFCKNGNEFEIKKIKGNESFNEILEKFLKTFREITDDYKEYPIIIDLTHSYRHFTMLKLLSTLMADFLIEGIEFYILYAKEIGKGKYEYINLNEYIDYYELFQAIDYFVSDLYAPEFFYRKINIYKNKSTKEKTIEIIFKELHDLGKAIRENNLESKNKAIWDIADEVLDKVEELEKQVRFLKEIFKYPKGKEFTEILTQIRELKYLEEYEKLINLADLTFNKNLLLNSAVYLMEGMVEFLYWKFIDKKILKKEGEYLTPEEYEKTFGSGGRYKTLNCLKRILIHELLYNGEGYEYKPKCKYKRDIVLREFEKNKEKWEEFAKLLEKIDEIRNNIAHVFRDADYISYKDEIEKILDKTKELIEVLK